MENKDTDNINIKNNFIYSSICQIFAIIVPLITTPYLSRVIGAEGIGNYSYVYSVASYFSLFIIWGLNNYGNRTIAIVRGERGDIDNTFWNIYAFQMLSGIFISFIYIIYLIFMCRDELYAWLMLGVVVTSCLDINWFFYGMEDFKSITVRDISIKLLTVIGVFVFVKNNNDTWKYILIRSIGYSLSQVMMWPKLLKTVRFVKPSREQIIIHIKPNLMLFLPTIAVSIYKIMDKIMLGLLSTFSEVGYYENCEKVIQVPMALIIAFGTVMLPHMSKFYSESNSNKEQAIVKIRNSEHYLMIISTVICFGFMGVADVFVPIFYGEGYERCIDIFYVLLPSCVFLAFANVIRTQYLIPNKMDREFIISLFVGAIVNVIINFLLIGYMGAVGTAIGTVVAEIVVCVMQMFFIRQVVPIFKIFSECLCYILIALIMMVMGMMIPTIGNNMFVGLVFKIIICGVLWSIMIFLLFSFDKHRREILLKK